MGEAKRRRAYKASLPVPLPAEPVDLTELVAAQERERREEREWYEAREKRAAVRSVGSPRTSRSQCDRVGTAIVAAYLAAPAQGAPPEGER